ncbi:MAG: alpha/beta fold hydrolase [Burkholderiales bacterium]|nr:alpha/beta fold hydrolase [Burkholderiales bacterium]
MPSAISVYPVGQARLCQLPLPGGQLLAYQRLGPEQAPAWLALHGGPGSGAQPGLWQAFDLQRQQVIAPDQRGSGRSRPFGSLRGQALSALIQDLERLRESLGLRSWSVMGGSWGATLALIYAARHPEAVDALVLRGSFRGTRREVVRLLRRFWPKAPARPANGNGPRGALDPRQIRPAQAGALLQRLSQLFRDGTVSRASQRAARDWQAMEQAAALHGARRAWRQAGEPEQRRQLKSAWQALRPGQLRRRLERPDWAPPLRARALWQKYRIQSHHLAHRCGLAPGQWQQALQSVADSGMAVSWIHGRFDTVCPPDNSLASHRLLTERAGARSRLWLTQAGHLGTEPLNRLALREAISRISHD